MQKTSSSAPSLRSPPAAKPRSLEMKRGAADSQWSRAHRMASPGKSPPARNRCKTWSTFMGHLQGAEIWGALWNPPGFRASERDTAGFRV